MSLLRTHSPRHVKSSAVAPALAIGGMTAALVLLDGAVSMTAASAAGASDFARLRQCESGGNYAINTGNGFYGAYQFDLGTWRGLGLSGLPSQAAPRTQDAAAARLQAARGWQPWPACSRRLGLGSSRAAAVPARASRTRQVPVRQLTVRHAAPRGVPAFAGHVLSVKDVHVRRADVAAWQHRMAARGWDIAVDGRFGPQSAGVAKRFAAEKRLAVARPGTVDRGSWNAAWALPVT